MFEALLFIEKFRVWYFLFGELLKFSFKLFFFSLQNTMHNQHNFDNLIHDVYCIEQQYLLLDSEEKCRAYIYIITYFLWYTKEV